MKNIFKGTYPIRHDSVADSGIAHFGLPKNRSHRFANKPICMTDACCNNDPNYPNNCAIWTNIEGCYLAQIRRPNPAQKILAWIDRYWLRIAVACLTASVFIIWTLFSWGLGATAAIDDLRAQQHQAMQQCKKR